jgi:hypothetical protein
VLGYLHQPEQLKEKNVIVVPVPQANSLPKIAAVVDAVSAGANEPAIVADALDVVSRQGSYYLNAAAYFGYVENTSDGWQLTDDGELFYLSTAPERAADMRQRIAEFPEIDTAQLSSSTAQRREASMKSWEQHLNLDEVGQSNEVHLAIVTTRSRAPQAVKRAADGAPHEAVLGESVIRTGTKEDMEEFASRFPHTKFIVRKCK